MDDLVDPLDDVYEVLQIVSSWSSMMSWRSSMEVL